VGEPAGSKEVAKRRTFCYPDGGPDAKLTPVVARYSDLQALNFPTGRRFPAHSRWTSASIRRSFLLTAAGQFRILTGFPFDNVLELSTRIFEFQCW